MAEEARLESVYTPKGYHEFESRSLRKRSEARRIAPRQTRKEESRHLIDDGFLRKILWTIIVLLLLRILREIRLGSSAYRTFP